MSAKFCHNCGSPLPENAKFCGSCGTPVFSKPVAAPVPEPAEEPAPVAAEPAAPAPSPVFTLDSLDEPAAPPEPPVKPVIFSLDSLPGTEETQPEPEPAAEPAPEAASVPEPAPVPQNKAKKEKAPKKEKTPKEKKGGWPGRSAGRTILAVLLCILIFVWSFASLTLLNTRLATTGAQGGRTLTAVVGSLDLTRIGAAVLAEDLQDPNASLADWIAEKITENYQGRVDLDPEDLKEFWEDSSFPAYLADHLNNCLTDIYTGSSSAQITAGDIEVLLQGDAALIDEIFDERLSEADIAHIAAAAVDSGVLELLSSESLLRSAGSVGTVARIGLSWWVIGGAFAVLLLLILLLGKVNRSALRTFGDTGITLMVTGALWSVGGLLILVMPDLWNALFYPIRPVGAAIAALLSAGLIPAAACFGTGTVMLLIKVIGKSIVCKSAKAQA